MWRLRKQRVGMMAMALAIVAVACNDSSPPDELTAQKNWLVKTWNSPEGEALVLKGVSPWDALDDSLSDAERDEVVSNATEELLRGCYATRLILDSFTNSGSTYHFLRGRAEDNAACETWVAEEHLHDSGLTNPLRCDLRQVKFPILDDNGMVDYSVEQEALFSTCQPVEDPLKRMPENALCDTELLSGFVCEIGLVCERYVLDDGDKSVLGTCAPGTPDEALAYAMYGQKSLRFKLADADWPYLLYEDLKRPTGDAASWTKFWTYILSKPTTIYATWNDAEGNRASVFRGHDGAPPGRFELVLDYLVAVSTNGEGRVYQCETLPVDDIHFDGDGQLRDIPAFIATVEAHCIEPDDGYPLAPDTICPAVLDSPFECADPEMVCEPMPGGWLSWCALPLGD